MKKAVQKTTQEYWGIDVLQEELGRRLVAIRRTEHCSTAEIVGHVQTQANQCGIKLVPKIEESWLWKRF